MMPTSKPSAIRCMVRRGLPKSIRIIAFKAATAEESGEPGGKGEKEPREPAAAGRSGESSIEGVYPLRGYRGGDERPVHIQFYH